MSDLISRQAAIDALMVAIDDVGILDGDDIKVVFDNLPSAQPEIIRCGECVHHVDNFFCRKANHYTSNGNDCMSVFGAERRTDEQIW